MMKARVKATGEIINIADCAMITFDKWDSYGIPTYLELKPEEIEFIQDVTEDKHWQDVRERAAIAVLNGILSNSNYKFQVSETSLNTLSKNAVIIADAIVKLLKVE